MADRSFLWNSRRVCALLVASSGLLWSQSNPVGNITGNVKGPDGKVVAGALVRLVTPRGDQQQRTNEQGAFNFRQMMAGRVQIKVSAPGMSGFDSSLTVVANQTSRLDVKLGALGVVVEVVDKAGLEALDTTQAKTGIVMTMDAIDELPIYYMGTDRLTATTFRAPGSVMDTVHGTDSSNNTFVVDGVAASDANYGTKGVSLNNDFIDQIQVLTSGISAKYGRFTGAVQNVTTKSGTNDWSGSMRLDITNEKWNSRWRLGESIYFLSKLYHFPITWDPVPDHHQITQSYTFLGPIIKDKLFFAMAYTTVSPELHMESYTQPSIGPRTPYTTTRDNYLLDAKVDWQMTIGQRLSFEMNESNSKDRNGTSSGKSSTLETLNGLVKSKTGYRSVGYVAQLASNLALDIKYNDRFNNDGGPGTGPTGAKNIPTWYELQNSDILDNGFGSDNYTQDHTHTGGANILYTFDAMGSHELEAGVQFYHYNRTGAASPTPSNFEINFRGYAEGATTYDLASRVLTANSQGDTSLEEFFPIVGEADSKVNSLYANDAWTLNPHWSFNIGLRFDQYKSFNNPEGISYDFNAFAPRLSANYDLKGDHKHVLNAGFAVYSGMINQGNLALASVSSSPITRTYLYIGTGGANQGNGLDALNQDGSINWTAWGNHYGQTGRNNPEHTSDPLRDRNIFVDNNIKAPRTREVTLGYTWTGSTQNFTATLVRRWNDQFLDDFHYGDGMGPGLTKIVIKNDPNAKQDYYGLEMTYRQRIGESINLGGNATWSRAFGNAGSNLGGATSQANDFGTGNIPTDQLNPRGPIPSTDVPVMINFDANYRKALGTGTLNLGLVGTYKSGAAYGFLSGMANVSDALKNQGYDGTYSRYFPGMGVYRQPEVWTMDMQTAYDQTIYGKVHAYVRVNVTNIFNRVRTMTRDYTGVAIPGFFVPNPTFGLGQGTTFPRMVQVVTGFKF
jgi:outer membrane receptor protein involved in Fe transport